jgi:hypothetical protein
MASGIKNTSADDRPLVGDVEFLGDPTAGRRHGREDRDEAIIRQLRDKLQGRDLGNGSVTLPPRPGKQPHAEGEDKYEQQRLGRKICWQYDGTARKVPLLRRHYI